MKQAILFTLFILIVCPVFSQYEADDKPRKRKFDAGNAVLISPAYTAQFPFGDLGNRYGFNNLISMNIFYKTKSNWLVGAEGGFLFGNAVKDNFILDNISTTNGQFISQDNRLLNIRLQQRGYVLKVNTGKLFAFSERYPDAGLLLLAGLGFLQHKIAIDVRQNLLPQLDKTYRKGYDRMCNGPVVSLMVGGMFTARKKLYSFYGGLQADIAFTYSRRNYDFYAQRKLNEKRVDALIGIKLGWVLPIFLQTTEQELFYY